MRGTATDNLLNRGDFQANTSHCLIVKWSAQTADIQVDFHGHALTTTIRMPALKGSPVRCENGEVCSRRLRILTGVPPHPEGPFFKSGLFPRSEAILTLFVSAIFHEKREIDLFARIARHKLPKTLIFASNFGLFTSADLNRANRPLTDRESHLRSGCGACVPTDGSMDRGVILQVLMTC